MKGLTPDPAVFEKHIQTLAPKLDAYDQILGKQKYLAGDVSLQFVQSFKPCSSMFMN